MSEKCTYATVGISEDREEPVIVTGKRNVSFEIGGEEFDRTATLRLPERMTTSEFNQWKSESEIDLIDIYFHCLKQKPRHAEKPAPEDAGGEVGDEEQSEIVTDGGTGVCPSCGEEGEQLPNLAEYLRACMNLDCRVNEFEVRAVTDGGSDQQPDLSELEEGNEVRVFYLSSRSKNEVDREGTVSEVTSSDENRIVRVHTEEREPLKHIFIVMTEAELNSGEERVFAFSQTVEPKYLGWEERNDLARPELGKVYTLTFEVSRNSYLGPVDRIVRTDHPPMMMTDGGEPGTDGGSPIPKLALLQLKELREVDSRLGDLLTEQTGDELESFSDIYATEHSVEAAGNEIQLAEGFSIPEAEFVELLGIIEQARASAADDPVPLGVRNRLLMQLILANPEEYARIKKEEAERQQEAQEEARQQFNEAMSRQRMNERMADLNNGVDIPLNDEEETDG
jgi:hypothetical protein